MGYGIDARIDQTSLLALETNAQPSNRHILHHIIIVFVIVTPAILLSVFVSSSYHHRLRHRNTSNTFECVRIVIVSSSSSECFVLQYLAYTAFCHAAGFYAQSHSLHLKAFVQNADDA